MVESVSESQGIVWLLNTRLGRAGRAEAGW